MLDKIDKKALETMLLIALIIILGIFVLLDMSRRLNELEKENKNQRNIIEVFEQRARALNK